MIEIGTIGEEDCRDGAGGSLSVLSTTENGFELSDAVGIVTGCDGLIEKEFEDDIVGVTVDDCDFCGLAPKQLLSLKLLGTAPTVGDGYDGSNVDALLEIGRRLGFGVCPTDESHPAIVLEAGAGAGMKTWPICGEERGRLGGVTLMGGTFADCAKTLAGAGAGEC